MTRKCNNGLVRDKLLSLKTNIEDMKWFIDNAYY